MKKNILFLVCVFMIFSVGCKKEIPETPDLDTSEIPIEEEPNQETKGTIDDYYPLLANKEYIYAGEGNEFASYNLYIDYLDEGNKKIQARMNNGGTEISRVMQIKDGNLTLLLTREEAYYRDNLLNSADPQYSEVLLKEPLVKGTKWILSDGRTRAIVNIEADIGEYKDVIEVTTEGKDNIVKDYYAKDVGLVKTIYSSGDYEVSSTLTEIREDVNYKQVLQIFYPGQDEKLHRENKTLTFKTNDITRIKIEEALKQQPSNSKLSAISSTNTKINSLYLGKDNIAYIDFSKELIAEMNAGAGFESLILQSITNTIGNYYGVEKVYLTVGGKPYESGHIALEKGELLKVDMSNVVDN